MKKTKRMVSILLALVLAVSTLSGAAFAVEKESLADLAISEASISAVRSEVNMVKSVFPQANIDVNACLEFIQDISSKSLTEQIKLYHDLVEAGPVETYVHEYPDGSYEKFEIFTPYAMRRSSVSLGTATTIGNVTTYTGTKVTETIGVFCYASFYVNHSFNQVTYVGNVIKAYSPWIMPILPGTAFGAPWISQSSGSQAQLSAQVFDNGSVGTPALYGTINIAFNASSWAVTNNW